MLETITPLRTLVLDDQPHAIELLTSYIAEVPFLELIYSATNPVLALQFMQQQPIDLIFLDVEMPLLSGLDVLKRIGDRSKVILTTGFREYAADAFEYNALDYLVKPFSFERFMQASLKAISATPPPVTQMADPGDKQLFGVLTEKKGKIIKVQWSEILYIESEKRDVAIYSFRSEPIRTSVSITDVEATLPASQFMRVHKSFIVNLEKIDYIEGGQIFLKTTGNCQPIIPLGRTYRSDFFRQFKLLGKRESNMQAL